MALIAMLFSLLATTAQVQNRMPPLSPPGTPCDHGPRVINPVQPAYPAMARSLGLGPLTAFVKITIDEKGHLERVWIFRTSGYHEIDEAAITAASLSTFEPARKNCRAVPGSLIVRAEFDPDN